MELTLEDLIVDSYLDSCVLFDSKPIQKTASTLDVVGQVEFLEDLFVDVFRAKTAGVFGAIGRGGDKFISGAKNILTKKYDAGAIGQRIDSSIVNGAAAIKGRASSVGSAIKNRAIDLFNSAVQKGKDLGDAFSRANMSVNLGSRAVYNKVGRRVSRGIDNAAGEAKATASYLTSGLRDGVATAKEYSANRSRVNQIRKGMIQRQSARKAEERARASNQFANLPEYAAPKTYFQGNTISKDKLPASNRAPINSYKEPNIEFPIGYRF